MDSSLIFLLSGGLFFIGSVILFVKSRGNNRNKEVEEELEKIRATLNSSMQEQTGRLVETIGKVREESKNAISDSFSKTRKELDESLSLGRKEMAETLSSSQKSVSEKLEKLIKESTSMMDASKTMLEVGKDIKQLSEILEGGQSRGSFGEFQLGLLLKNIIPSDRYKEQYKIGDGVVDAAIFFKDVILCIDSKFPFANLKKSYDSPKDEAEEFKKLFYSDVKKRAKEISKKYILPEKTLDFAIMFIPSESVFLEIVANTSLHKSIIDINVVPASPNFLYVYFQALAIGFKGLAIESEAKEILNTISSLKVLFDKFNENFKLVGRHLGNAQNQFFESEKQAGKLESKLENLNLGKGSNEIESK